MATLDAYLGALVRLRTRDGRTFVGKLKCFDHSQSVILSESDEYFPAHDGRIDPARARKIGAVIAHVADVVAIDALEPPAPAHAVTSA